MVGGEVDSERGVGDVGDSDDGFRMEERDPDFGGIVIGVGCGDVRRPGSGPRGEGSVHRCDASQNKQEIKEKNTHSNAES